MKKYTRILTAAIGFGFALGSLSQVYAQEPDEFTLEEITVTAQKRAENQQKVAIAMDVISGDTMKDLGRTDIEQILSNVSNIVISKYSGSNIKIGLRGITNYDVQGDFGGGQSGTATVAMNFDGIASGRTDQGMNLYDLERVEVLYGPQATLYSTNTPGGIINVVTAAPKLDVFEGSGTLEYGNYGLLHTEGFVNAPISKLMAVRAAFSTSTHKGYNSNGTNDEDGKSARLRYLFQPNERISFMANGEYMRESGRGFAFVVAFKNQDDTDNPWTAAGMGPPGAPPTEATTTPQPTYSDRYKVYGQVQADAGIGTITFLPSYVTLNRTQAMQDMMNNNAPQQRDNRMREKSFELRMGSKADSPFTYIFGLSYYSSLDVVNSITDYPFPAGAGYPSPWEHTLFDTKNKNAYGNITYPVTDAFRITGGLRRSDDKFHSLSIAYPGWGQDYTAENPTIEDGVMKYNGTDYKAGIEYDIAEDVMLYADTSTSYRTQGMAFQQIPTAGGTKAEPFPPEKLKAYNAGMKGRFFENSLQLNVAGYYYDYRDFFAQGFQQTIVDDNKNGKLDPGEAVAPTDVTLDRNAMEVGDAEVYGFDISSNMIITNKDKLDLSVSYLHKQFTHMVFDYYDITNDIGIGDLDLSGKPMTNAPEWTINAAYSHNFPLANGGVITARLDSKYVSEYIVSWNNVTVNIDMFTFVQTLTDTTAYNKQEPYHISNLSMVYADPSGKWNFSGYVKNIEDYAAKVGGNGSTLNVTAPRTYGGILTVRF